MPRVKSFNNRKKTKLSCSLEKQKIEQVVCIVFTTGIISDVGSSCINKLIKNFMRNISCRKSIALNHSYLQSQDDPKSSYSRTDVEVVEMDSEPKIKELSINKKITEERMWTVVQFEDDTVPTIWIQGDFCHWPSMAPPKLMMAIRKCEPLNTCWPTHKIKVFRNATFDVYMKARNKAKDAEQTSYLASETEVENNRRKRIQKVLSSSDNSDESILPSPPKQCHLKNETAVLIPPLQENIVVQNIASDAISHLPHQNSAITQQENYLPQHQYCCQGCKDNESKLKVIIEQNHLIRSISTDILSAIKEKGERDTYKKRHGSLYTDFNINFPINCLTDLEKFEEIMKQEDHFDEAVIELAKLGGANNYNFVKRVMTSLMSNEEASEFSWQGRKGKKPFHNLLIAKLVLDAAEKAHKAMDRKETEISLQSWLKRARERRQQSSLKKF